MELTLEKFLENLRAQVDKFETDYREGQRTQPSVYPAAMSEADWAEQFASFVGFDD